MMKNMTRRNNAKKQASTRDLIKDMEKELNQIGEKRDIEQEDFDALLKQAIGLVDDQQLLTKRNKEIEEQQNKMMEKMGKEKLI